MIQSYQNEYLIIGDIEVTIFSLAQQLVGMEKFLLDMATGAEYIEPLLRACTEFQTAIGLRLIAAGVDALWAGDDFGTQKGLLFSPAMFRRIMKPHYVRMNRAFREAKPDFCDSALRRRREFAAERLPGDGLRSLQSSAARRPGT